MSYELAWNKYGVISNFSGEIDSAEVSNCDQEIFVDERFSHCKFFIYDFSKADLSNVTLGDTHRLGANDVTRADLNKKMKGALVSDDELTSQICDQYVKYCKAVKISWEVRRFKCIESAHLWATS